MTTREERKKEYDGAMKRQPHPANLADVKVQSTDPTKTKKQKTQQTLSENAYEVQCIDI